MKCEKIKEILLITEEKTFPDEVKEHLKVCEICMNELKNLRVLKSAFGDNALRKTEPALSFEVLMASVRMKEEHLTQRKRKLLIWGGVSSLVTITFTFLLIFLSKPEKLTVEDEITIAEHIEVLENMEVLENLSFFEHYEEVANEGG